jgi:hypothetical protein
MRIAMEATRRGLEVTNGPLVLLIRTAWKRQVMIRSSDPVTKAGRMS